MRLERAAACNLIFLAGALLCACGAREERPPLGVVLISIDTLRPDHLGFNGYARPTSPCLDALAGSAAVFEQAIAQAPWTTPSHAAMLMSQYPSALRLGGWNDPGVIHPDAVSLAEVFQRAGHRTHAVVAGGFVSGKIGFAQGFEEYDETGYDMTMTVDRGLAWLDGLERDAPFFLFLHTYDVHKYNPPGKYKRSFDHGYAGPLLDQQYLARFVQNENHEPEAAARLGADDLRYIVDMYDAAINYVDHEIGRVVERLEERGLRGRTLLVITSDHGEEFREHGRTGHGYNLHDENLRVPLLFAHPSLPARRVQEQVRLLDLAPTIADLAGLRPDPSWQGTSLRPFLEGGKMNLPALSEHAHYPMKSARTLDAKLIVARQAPHRQLFDLRRDPGETRDALAEEGEIGARLGELLLRWHHANMEDGRFLGAGDLEMSPELRRQLDELGYVSAGGGGADEEWVEPALRGEKAAK
ncbi:MAG: sulfatase [Planctomycetes bacterium]|nr:sulfatase [Planctomycetota bacterium]